MSSTPAHPTLALLAFTAPAVKAGSVVFGVRTKFGLTDLIASPALARDLGAALTAASAELIAPASEAPAVARQRVARGSVETACAAAWADLTADLTLTVGAAALRHNLHRGTLCSWIDRTHPRELSALRNAALRAVRAA